MFEGRTGLVVQRLETLARLNLFYVFPRREDETSRIEQNKKITNMY